MKPAPAARCPEALDVLEHTAQHDALSAATPRFLREL